MVFRRLSQTTQTDALLGNLDVSNARGKLIIRPKTVQVRHLVIISLVTHLDSAAYVLVLLPLISVVPGVVVCVGREGSDGFRLSSLPSLFLSLVWLLLYLTNFIDQKFAVCLICCIGCLVWLFLCLRIHKLHNVF